MKLTRGEALWLWMRRERHLNADVARIFRVSERTVTEWLADRDDGVTLCPDVKGREPLTDWERIAVARRRKGWGLRVMADKLGMSHVTLIRRERGMGDVEGVVRWWMREEGGWPPRAGTGEGRAGVV